MLTEPGDFLGKASDRVVVRGLVASPVAGEVGGDHAMRGGQVLDLRRQIRVIAAPAVHEERRRATGAGVDVKEQTAARGEARHRWTSARQSRTVSAEVRRAASRISRTLAARASGVNGLDRNGMPDPSTPCFTMASSV